MKRFKSIILYSGLGEASASAFKRAVQLAERNNAELKIVDVIEDVPKAFSRLYKKKSVDLMERAIQEKEKEMAEIVSSKLNSSLSYECKVLKGTPFIQIIREVLKYDHDLVIMPAEGKSKFRDHILGSTSMHLMRKCPCPVWVVKSSGNKKYYRILAPIKFDDRGGFNTPMNVQVMELATSLAQWDDSTLDILNVWRLYGGRFLNHVPHSEINAMERSMKNELKTEINSFVDPYRMVKKDIQLHLKKGETITVIPKMIRELQIDLIIMGTVSRQGIGGLLIGNTAEEVLQQANCSVLTLKPEGFITPVKL